MVTDTHILPVLCVLLSKPWLLYDPHRGNWWGHSPYKHGTPCSACPPSYGGGCKDNLCYKGTCGEKKEKDRVRKNEENLAYYTPIL